VLSLRRESNVPFEGTVIESQIDGGIGISVVGLIHKGMLKVGDFVVAGAASAKIRMLLNDQNKPIQEAYPSMPVKIIGFDAVPNVGESIIAVNSDEEAQNAVKSLMKYSKNQFGSRESAMTYFEQSLDSRESVTVPIVIKADVIGSIEAIRGCLLNITASDDTTSCKTDIVFSNLGPVSKADISMAAASKSLLVAFNVGVPESVQELARSENVEVNKFNVLYDVIDFITAAVNSHVRSPPQGSVVGTAQIQKIFTLGKGNKVGGCIVLTGKIIASSQIRVLRGSEVAYVGKLASLKVVKEDVQEVPMKSECGIVLQDFNELQEGDIIECFV